jgi:hypothetical protein
LFVVLRLEESGAKQSRAEGLFPLGNGYGHSQPRAALKNSDQTLGVPNAGPYLARVRSSLH